MLRFKSLPIRYFETFLKSVLLLVGYLSESQRLYITMTGFKEGIDPTVCLRVILEQRAEFKPGAGIPEIYAASLTLESELPLLKSIIWKWRKTIFVWTCIWFFGMELFFILVCCRPFIIPRANPRNGSGNRQEHVRSKQEIWILAWDYWCCWSPICGERPKDYYSTSWSPSSFFLQAILSLVMVLQVYLCCEICCP